MLLSLLVGSLATGCFGGRYQAPISEQSEVMDRSGPVIVSNSDDSPSRYGRDGTPPAPARAPVSRPPEVLARPPVHVVARGDSLYSIAFQYDLDARNVALANNLSPPYTIFVGQELSLDINQPAIASEGEASLPSVGRAVGNNEVARAQPAAATIRNVIRQPITPAADQQQTQDPEWEWPLKGRIITNFQADTSDSKGIDIGAINGQPVHAAAAGEVVYAGNGIQGSGNLVIIRHDERLLSAYAHNRAILVTQGQRLRAGQQIGEAGVNAEGVPLLHFEIRLDGKPVDPLNYLPRS